MQAPRFWGRPPEAPGWLAHALTPLSWVWSAVLRRRLARGKRLRLGVPVICVGNLTAGGAGKTPAVIAICERLMSRGVAAQVISRGHGGRITGPVVVDQAGGHSAGDVGDEPLLLSAFAPVVIARDRAAAGQMAAAGGAGAVVMDDGFQNASLAVDVAIVVVDAEYGFGNGRVMPAGPLRESVPEGLARADLILVIGPADARARLVDRWPVLAALPRAGATLRPLATGMDWNGFRALAFAGIGRPEKFFSTLREAGAEIVAAHGFADHARYDARLLARLAAEARAANAQLVTTEKDAVRLPEAFRKEVLVMPVRLEIEDWSALEAHFAALGL